MNHATTNTPTAAAGRFDDGIPERSPGGAPSRPHARMLTCDQHPGKTMTARAWEELTGIKGTVIYQSTWRGHAAGGLRFHFVGESPKGGKPPKKTRIPRTPQPAAAVATRAPVQPAMQTAAANAPALDIPALDGAQIARLIASLDSNGEQDIAALINWVLMVRSGLLSIKAALAGKVRFSVIAGKVVSHV